MFRKSKHSVEEVREARDDKHREVFAEVMEAAEMVREQLPNSRRPWMPHVVSDMWDEQDGLCELTGDPLNPDDFEVDHIVPHSLGGGNERSNLRLVTRTANRQRGNRGIAPDELLDYLEDRFMNR